MVLHVRKYKNQIPSHLLFRLLLPLLLVEVVDGLDPLRDPPVAAEELPVDERGDGEGLEGRLHKGEVIFNSTIQRHMDNSRATTSSSPRTCPRTSP